MKSFDNEKVREMILKLEPIIGKEKSEKMWIAYNIGDNKEKDEIEETLAILSIKLLSHAPAGEMLFAPPDSKTASGDYEIGKVVYNAKEVYPFCLRDKELCEHTGIFGRSGSGKSTLLFNMILSILKKNPEIKLLAFDWKQELRSLVAEPSIGKEISVYTVGRDNVSGIRFNPLIPPPGTIITNHLEHLLDIICQSFYAGEGVYDILTRAIDQCYREFGVYKGIQKRYPTFKDIHYKIENFKLTGRQNEWRASALRITRALGFGEFGKIVNITEQYPLEQILNKNVIMELDSLSSTKRAFFISSLLLWLYHYELCKRTGKSNLKQLIIIEEAHNIAKKRAESSKEAVIEMIIRQCRFLGMGIVLVDQTPSEISPVAMANIHVHVNLNQRNVADINTASANLLLTKEQKKWLSQLRVGEAIVRLSNRYTSPFLIRIPAVPLKDKVIEDNYLKKHMEAMGYFADSSPKTQENEAIEVIPETANMQSILLEKDLLFIKDIIKYPFEGVAKRYKRLNMSAREGNNLKNKLIKQGIIEPEEINTGKAIISLLNLSAAGEKIAKEKGLYIKKINGRASLEHEYWRNRIANYCKALGYEIKFEVPSNGYADVIADKNEFKIAIEIETGKADISDAISNIERNLNAGYEMVISVATNIKTMELIQNKLKEKGLDKNEKVRVVLATKFCDFQ